MISEEDREYIEITRNFPLTANDFKIGNAKNEDVQKIKQHQRIEKAILENDTLEGIRNNVTKKDMELILEYRKCGFSIGEISLLCREVSLQTAISAYVFDNGGTLDHELAKVIGLTYKEKEIFDTPPEVREIIRLDGCGYLPNSKNNKNIITAYGKLKPLNYLYQKEIYDDSKYELVGGHFVKEKKKVKNSQGKKVIEEKEVLVDAKKELRKDLHIYSAKEYDLNTSDTWKNVFSKFKNFRNFEKQIIKEMQKYSFNPKIVEHMGIYEFVDIINKSFGSDKKSIHAFNGSISKKIMDELKKQDNAKMVEKYLRFNKMNPKLAKEKINDAQNTGSLFGNLSEHHIVHVSNAGENIDYELINHPSNLITVSEFMHKLIHSADTFIEKGDRTVIAGFFPEKETHDMMLGITPLFRTPYTGERIQQKELTIFGVKSFDNRSR